MESRTSSDILRHISLSKLMPVILVGITVLIAIGAFTRIGISLVTLGILIALPLGIFILVSYQKLLPLVILASIVPITIPMTRVLNMSLHEIVIPLLFFIYVLQRMIHRSNYSRVSFHDIPKSMILLTIIGIVWFIASGDLLPQNIFRFQGLGAFRNYFTFFVGIMGYFLMLSLIKEEKHIRQIVKILFWIAIISILYQFTLVALYQKNIPFLRSPNWSIYYLEANRFAIRSVAMGDLGLVLFLILLTGEYPKTLKVRIPLIVFSSIAISYSGGRGVFLGWILSILIYLFIKKKYFILTGAFILSIVIISIPFLIPESVATLPKAFQRIFVLRSESSIETAGGAGVSIKDRLERWTRSFEEIKRKPITGIGFSGFEVELAIYGELQGQELINELAIISGATANGYINYALIFGIPGFILFMLVWFNSLRHLTKMYRKHPDQHVRNISFFLLLLLYAYIMVYMSGGGPQDFKFMMYLGLSQAIWILVLNNQKKPDKEKSRPLIVNHPAFSSAIEG